MQKWLAYPMTPYLLPLLSFFIIHLGFSGIDPKAPYVTYPLSVLVCTGLVLYFRKRLPPLLSFVKPGATVVMGLVAAAFWILPYEPLSAGKIDYESGYNPANHFENPSIIFMLFAIRLLGLSITIPLIEEIFWRGGLQRYLVKEDDFESVPLGTFTIPSYFGTAFMIILAHSNQIGVAFIWAFLSTTWFMYTKSLGSMILLHVVVNFTLGVYVLITGKYFFW